MMNSICRCSIYYTTLFLFLCFHQGISYTTDSINSSQIFRDDNSTLISSGGRFELGFFGPENSKNRYLGIWYKKMPVRTVVWVANRENPLKDASGMLKVIEPGHLLLLNGTNGVVWSSNASRTVQNPVAQLLNSGNLVLKDANNDDDPDNFVWQSFDYPTDTILPGMKFGWNLKTGLEVYITSWKRSDDPASGDYTFRLDPTDHPQMVLRKGTDVVSRTGPWNGVSFGWSPNNGKNVEMVVNMNEVYYRDSQQDESAFTRHTISESGVLQRLVWTDRTQVWNIYISMPSDNCDTYSICGAYANCNIDNSPVSGCLNKFQPKDPQGWDRGNWSSGCNRSAPLDCRKGDGFLKYSGMKLPDIQHSWSNRSMTLKECRTLCLNNCSCTAYTSLDISRGENGCLIWLGELVDFKRMFPGQDIYIKVASSELGSEKRKQEIVIVTSSLVVGVVLLSLSLYLYLKRRKKADQLKKTGLNYSESHKDLELPLFDLSTISKATNNFSIDNKLGEGGFGPVFKGMLEDGRDIDVKRLSTTSLQGVDELKNEVICVAKLQHRNLVKLLGWCIHGEEMMLVYEYMPNKSLDLILFDQVKSAALDWPRRFNIINSIARGLSYLHQDSCPRVIHRDLKDMNPKISDFGLARTFGGNETGANTSRVVGTYGYMSPEYATYGLFSVKSDVFSFGVLVLEIVTGMRNRGFSYRGRHANLLAYAWMLYREGRSLELVDSSFQNSCNVSEVLRSIYIGLLCVQESPEERPSMPSVVQMLGNDGVLPEAKHPGFFTGIETETPGILCPTSSTMSITLLEPR